MKTSYIDWNTYKYILSEEKEKKKKRIISSKSNPLWKLILKLEEINNTTIDMVGCLFALKKGVEGRDEER